MEGPEWDAHAHGTVHSGSGSEEKEIIIGGGEGGHRKGFQRLWDPPGDGKLLRIPGAGDIGNGKRLDGGGEEIGLGKKGLE